MFILTAISLFQISSVNAADLTFNTLEEVDLGKEFEVKISYLINDTYDVKIVVQDISDKKSLSEIFSDNKWTSSFYFILGVYPKIDKFQLRVKTYSDNSEICVKVRKTSDKKGAKELCKPIKIKENIGDDKNINVNNSNSTSNPPEKDTLDDQEKDDSNDKSSENQFKSGKTISSEKPAESVTPEIIFLGSDNDNKITKPVFVTKEEKIRLGVVYSFAALCIILIVLLSFNKL